MKLDQVVKTNINARELRKSIAEKLNQNGVTYGELEILFTLSKKLLAQPSEISSYLHIEPAIVSRKLKLLHDKNLITFTHDTEDRRRVYVKFTKQGKRITKSIFLNAV